MTEILAFAPKDWVDLAHVPGLRAGGLPLSPRFFAWAVLLPQICQAPQRLALARQVSPFTIVCNGLCVLLGMEPAHTVLL